MTTVVAVKKGKTVTFAWDQQVTRGYRAVLGVDKVFTNGPVTFGVSGAVRSAGVLRHMEIPPLRDYEPDFDAGRWIVKELVPKIIKALDEVKALFTDHGRADSEASIILHVAGRVGYLGGDLSYFEDPSGAYAVGSGSAYALAALHNGASPKKAIETAINFDIYSGGEPQELVIK